MATTIAKWGNSAAVRIPHEVLERAGLKAGDRVDFTFGPNGIVMLVPVRSEHRRVAPAPNVSFESLFAGYEGGRISSSDAWPSDELMGSERDAWSG